MTLLIHPGFHKTGTTWLQTQLFTDRRLFNMMFSHVDVDELLVRPHDLHWSAERTRAAIDERRSPSGSRLVDVISSEILGGNPFSGSRDSRTLAERLHTAAGPAKILLTVRAQAAILRSLYIQYIKRGGRMSPAAYLAYRPEPGYFWFSPEVLRFHEVASHYGRLFGDANVLVLPQELLAHDRSAYFAELVRFATGSLPAGDIAVTDTREVGASPPSSGLGLLRFANLIRRTPVNPEALTTLAPAGELMHSVSYRLTLGRKRSEEALKAVFGQALEGHFGESNRRLQQYVPVDLAALGYEMSK